MGELHRMAALLALMSAAGACGSVEADMPDAAPPGTPDAAPGDDGGAVDGDPLPDVAPGLCNTDVDCVAGGEWCVGGACVPCDNSGTICDIACPNGWAIYERNGCFPCECAPPNDCAGDNDCAVGMNCYAGAFCWDWCPPGEPSCCYGNMCSAAGCPEPPPSGCVTRGCPIGQSCDTTSGCAPSACDCAATPHPPTWICTEDCGGGVCI